MSNHTMLFHVGAEKAGSSWLHKYLCQNPEYQKAPTKEMMVVDFPTVLCRTSYLGSKHFRQDINNYFDYFENHIKLYGRLSGDFTQYEGCTENILLLLSSGFIERGIDTKATYLIRDPIERAWSCYKMLQTQVRLQYGKKDVSFTKEMPLPAQLLLEKRLAPNYIETIQTLDSVFGGDSKVFIYEDFFKEERLREYCAFVGVPYVSGYEQVRVNSSQPNEMPEDFINMFGKTKRIRETYEAVSERFGRSYIENLWKTSNKILNST